MAESNSCRKPKALCRLARLAANVWKRPSCDKAARHAPARKSVLRLLDSVCRRAFTFSRSTRSPRRGRSRPRPPPRMRPGQSKRHLDVELMAGLVGRARERRVTALFMAASNPRQWAGQGSSGMMRSRLCPSASCGPKPPASNRSPGGRRISWRPPRFDYRLVETPSPFHVVLARSARVSGARPPRVSCRGIADPRHQ